MAFLTIGCGSQLRDAEKALGSAVSLQFGRFPCSLFLPFEAPEPPGEPPNLSPEPSPTERGARERR
jgi:hypothetical protein